MDIDLESTITLFGIILGSIIAIFGLFQNAAAVRQNNRISISTKLLEASKLISGELVARSRSNQLFKAEIKKTENLPDSEEKVNKLITLKNLLGNSVARQAELDDQIKRVEALFLKLDSVDVGALDAEISQSYIRQSLATSSFEFAKELNEGKA